MDAAEKHQHCVTQFVELANKLQQESFEEPVISAALMAASGVYATFVAAGNEGGLEPTGVDKVVAAYRGTLEHIQSYKKAESAAKVTTEDSETTDNS